jgi:hypothetical protein
MSLMRAALVAGWALLLAPVTLAGDFDQSAAPPFGDIEHLGAPPIAGIVPEERLIEHDLNTTESRVLRRSQRPLEKQEVQRELGATEQRLDAFKTLHPNAAATPLFERHLDRLERPGRILQPGPPTLLEQR